MIGTFGQRASIKMWSSGYSLTRSKIEEQIGEEELLEMRPEELDAVE